MLELLKRIFFFSWKSLCLCFPINKKAIFLSNFRGRGWGCNPKQIAIALHELDPSLKYYWWSNKGCKKSTPVWVEEISSFWRLIFVCATSKIWIHNVRFEQFTNKRKNQYYVQTWHGHIALKKIEKDAEDKLSDYYLSLAKQDSKAADLFLSSSEWVSSLYRSSFWWKGETFLCGSPRLDPFFAEQRPTKIHDELMFDSDVKFALYCPTFRESDINGSETKVSYLIGLDVQRMLEALKKRFGLKIVMLIRFHPNVSNADLQFQFSDEIINVTSYPDMYELMLECDYMINDYSTTMFEFGYFKRPVFLYANDIEDYVKERGLYFSMNELPFSFASNIDELEQNILKFDSKEYEIKFDSFMRELGVVESGHAAVDVAHRILKEIYGEKKYREKFC